MVHQIDAAAVLPVIGKIYDAALDPRQWPAVLSTVAALHDTDKALLLTPGLLPRDGGLALPVGIPQSAMQLWEAKYAQHDVWVQAAMERGLFLEGTVTTDSDLYPHEQLLASVWYGYTLGAYGRFTNMSALLYTGSAMVFLMGLISEQITALMYRGEQ